MAVPTEFQLCIYSFYFNSRRLDEPVTKCLQYVVNAQEALFEHRMRGGLKAWAMHTFRQDDVQTNNVCSLTVAVKSCYTYSRFFSLLAIDPLHKVPHLSTNCSF